MGRAYTDRKKRDNKKAAAAFQKLGEVPKRQRDGKRKSPITSKDPRKTALDARCRMFGVDADQKGRKRVTAPHMGCEIGMVIEAHEKKRDDVDGLWATLCQFSAVNDTFRVRIIGRKEEPACASIASTDEYKGEVGSIRVDLRSDDEKDRAARVNYDIWMDHVHSMTALQKGALDDARRGVAGLWVNQRATTRGIIALQALRVLRKAVEEK